IGSIAVVLYTVSVLFNTIIQSIYKMMIPVYHSAVAIAIDVIVLYLCLKFTGNGLVSLVAGNLTLPVVVIILNYITLKKDINLKINWLKAVIIPAVSSLIMGLIILLLYKGLLKVTGNTIALFVTIIAGVIIFFLCLILFKDIKEDELYQLPKGATIVRLLKKLHVM
ncbi:MAG: polysaccharide biosynthesis C-terminal domain-containing protein, partial [Lachnospiraceae bacterium]|nr:polysaccharide biosynthesis C-terminal domain-containing protein [Lachnospiraceae bacterium]